MLSLSTKPLIIAILITAVKTAPAPQYYDDNTWPCGAYEWMPPMYYPDYNPCQVGEPLNNRLDWNNPTWDGNVYPDCCVDNCLPECPPPYPDPVVPVNPACPWPVPGWAHIDGHEIYLGVSNNGLSWFEADAKALEAGGQLFEINSSEENLIVGQISSCYPSGTQFWIGGNDLAHSGTWVWSSGNSIAGYTNFANNNAGTTGHCMEVKADGRWFRSNCHGQDGSHAFIGEKDPLTSPTTSTTTTTTTTTVKPPFSTRSTWRPTFFPTTAGGGDRPTPVK